MTDACSAWEFVCAVSMQWMLGVSLRCGRDGWHAALVGGFLGDY